MISDEEFEDVKKFIKKDITRKICHKCNGYGVWETEYLEDYHKGIYGYHKHDCEVCGTKGMVDVRTYKLEITRIYIIE